MVQLMKIEEEGSLFGSVLSISEIKIIFRFAIWAGSKGKSVIFMYVPLLSR